MSDLADAVELSALARAIELNYDCQGEVKCSIIPQGCDNLNVFTRDDRSQWAVRIYAITPYDEVTFELNLMEFLAERSFPIARPIRNRRGQWMMKYQERPMAVFEWVQGERLDSRRPDALLAVTQLLAKLHKETTNWEPPTARSRTDIARLDAYLAGTKLLKQEEGERIRFLTNLCEKAREQISALNASPEAVIRRCALHHDMHTGNILESNGKIVALLDFDEAYYGPAVLDIAALLHIWACTEDHIFVPSIGKDVVAWYDGIRSLTPGEVRALPNAFVSSVAADAAEFVRRNSRTGRGFASAYEECNGVKLLRFLTEKSDWKKLMIEKLVKSGAT
jgi:homoserine kinase type II